MDIKHRRTAFAKRFNSALQKAGKDELSGEEVVKLLARQGVATTSQTVSNWRNAKYIPKLEQFEGIARMLGMDPGELAFGVPRTAETRASYGGKREEQSILDGLALLGDQEREVLLGLIRLLGSTRERPGRRRATAND
ncbi:hypothetical protein [Luteimonas terricola]|uniref:HTH cro/C1-type domain-containing protein n=1 Tax=Luteimonas terricola TaxID=645597 RepID=A0ABQ2E713_9GAMM|nr:hypothetical protein [Luteimonas terricola]GGJ97868.1 hypothetical protein GCM10011394_03490 [Luteimonas terricola]